MKKIIALIISFTLVLSFNMSASAKMNKQGINLTEHQEKMLKAFGLSEEEIANITMQEIRELLAKGEFKDLSKMGITNMPKEENVSKDIKIKLKTKELSEQKIEILLRMGYTYQEILDLDEDTIRSKFKNRDIPYDEVEYSSISNTNVSLLSSIKCPICGTYNHPVPANMIYVPKVPYDTALNEYFHQDCNPLSLESSVPAAQAITEYTFSQVFNGSESSPNIKFSYNLHGEWNECLDPNYIHEGIDILSKVSNQVKSVAKGKVVRVDTANNFLCIYNPDLGVTIQYEHLSNIPTTIKVGGPDIVVGQVIGQQNTSDNHIHIQVCTDFECKIIHTCNDSTHILTCKRPYGFLWWYI